MAEIWKFPLTAGKGRVSMPRGAKPLTVQVQRGDPCIWALVDPDAPAHDRFFNVYGTGWPMPAFPGDYIGTFQLESGNLVFHVFETPLPIPTK